jgi:dihydroorotate dehydrogenase (NAD+) catalytic subunit
VVSGLDAAELIMAGANAVQVGTATFENPRAALRVQRELIEWCASEGVTDIRDLMGAAQR